MADPLDAVWRVILRDFAGNFIDEIDNWVSLTAISVFNGVGSFELTIAADGVSARVMNPYRGIVITRNDETVFSGQIFTQYSVTPSTISVAGLCDNFLLNRPALPDPLGPPYNSAYSVKTGAASTIMREYAFENLSLPFCRADREVANLLITADPVLGSSMTGRAGGQRLVSLLREIASTGLAGGLGFRILQSPDSSYRQFSIYQPQDRSDDVKFGYGLGTASNFTDSRTAPEANYIYVMGGDGFGFNGRTIKEAGDDASIAEWGLIEGLIDARDVTNDGELEQRLAESLAGAVTSRKVNVSPLESESMQYKVHWDLGDLVSFVTTDGSNTFIDVIREIRFDFTKDSGVVITPMLGEANSTNDSLVSQHIASVQDRLSNVERNWRVPDNSITPEMLTAALVPVVGEVKWLTQAAAPTGYKVCDGSEISRTVYADLWNHFVTEGLHLVFGLGSGGVTFNLPDLRGRTLLGASSFYTLGSVGGATSVTPPAHTHPGDHSHTINNHSHTIPDHRHEYSLTHDHASFNSGGASTFSSALSTYPGSTTGTDHRHAIDVPTFTSSSNDTTDKTGFVTDDKTGMVTEPESTGHAADYGSAVISTMQPYMALLPVIYTGV